MIGKVTGSEYFARHQVSLPIVAAVEVLKSCCGRLLLVWQRYGDFRRLGFGAGFSCDYPFCIY